MSDELFKFPSTPHLAWLGCGSVRGDKVMSSDEAAHFLSGSVIVEEKVDGANLGISLDVDGELRFQNRGNWLTGQLGGQWEWLRSWVGEYDRALRGVLSQSRIIFGEWCYAEHSIHYDRLPDLFVVFDVYDREHGRFWCTSRRDELAKTAGLASVPKIACGEICFSDLCKILADGSVFGDVPREGLYLRREASGWLSMRAKLVNALFTQAISEHWSNKKLIRNRVIRADIGAITCR